LYGVIKENRLLGLYHKYDDCPNLFREERTIGGAITKLHSKVKKKHPHYCRWCIYLEAEELHVNCFEICPQLHCLTAESLPKEMKKEIERWKDEQIKTSRLSMVHP